MGKTTPVVKWAGGKRQLIPTIKEMMPEHFNRYYEPFFGGGALFCELEPKQATINDFNEKLINVYRVIKKNADGVSKELTEIEDEYNALPSMPMKDMFYYEYRNRYNRFSLFRECIEDEKLAALFIFLNKAAFNGLYRENRLGQFNVSPAHRKTIKLCDTDNIVRMSELLKKAKIMSGDFERACKDAKAGDFVFFDSPYYDTFDDYQAGGFSTDDHMRLFNLFKSLTEKGVYCMLTNNDCDFIKDLYKDYKITTVGVKRMINCDSKKRTGTELIVINY